MNNTFRKIIAYVLVFTMAMTMNVNVFAAADVVAQTEPTATVEDVHDHEHSEDGTCLVEEESTTDETAAGEEEQVAEDATEAEDQTTESDDESVSQSAEKSAKAVTPAVTGKAQTLASTTHSHPMCGSSCKCTSSTHAGKTWQAWDGTSKLYNGSYYLTKDVVLNSTMSLNNGYTTYLCLNGHSITCEDTAFQVYNKSKLIITDCSGAGKIESTSGSTIWCYQANVTIWGGTIYSEGYEAIYASPSSNILIYNGTIDGDIYIYGESGNLSKLQISGGTVKNSYNGTVSVSLDDVNFSMTGGYINDYVTIYDYTGESSATISGGTIGGRLWTQDLDLSISGGNIGGLWLYDGDTTISAGKFSGESNITGNITISGGDFSLCGDLDLDGETWINGGYFDDIRMGYGSLYLSGVPEIGDLGIRYPDTVSAQNPDGTGSYGGNPIGVWFWDLSGNDNVTAGDIAIKNVISDAIAEKFVLTGQDAIGNYLERVGNNLVLRTLPHGTWGNNVNWVIDDGTLTLSGNGAIAEADSGLEYPWGDYNDEITKIVVEPGITVIPRYTFEYCENVEEIILPETVTSLCLQAFNDCGSLNNLLVPSSVTTISGSSNTGYPAFIRCESLTDVYYLGTKEEWNAIANTSRITSADSNMTIHFLGKTESTATCTEPGVQAYYQFDDTSVYKDMYDLDKNVITELETVPALGHSYGEWVVDQEPVYGTDGSRHATCSVCGDVKTEVLTVGTVDSGKCGASLNWTMFEDGTLEIAGTGAMDDYGVEDYITTAPWAEYYNDNPDHVIKKVVLLEGVTHIGDYAFYRMYWVDTPLSIPESCESIGDYAFYNGDFTGELVLPEGIKAIGDYAFGSNSFTGDLLLPDSLTTLGSNAFVGCSKLTGELTLPKSISEIPERAFSGCKFTGKLVIPESVTKIGDSAFYSCDFTGELVIPENVRYIGVGAFTACKGFTGFPQLPSGLETINESVFKACSGLTGPVEIPESVTSIGKDAFYGCTNLAGEINLSENVQEIGPGAFWNTKVKKIEILNADCAFDNTSSSAISSSAIIYGYAGSTADIHAAKYNQPFIAIDSQEEEGILVSGTCGENLSWALGEDGVLTISGTGAMDDYNGSAAPWKRYKSLMNSLVLEDGITYIGKYAFEDCSTLKGNLVIPESVAAIGHFAFTACSGFTGDLIIPEGVTSVGNMAFCGCYNLNGELTLPVGLITIGSNAFSDCSKLTGELYIPDSVESIGAYAFAFSNNITGFVEIPDNVTVVNMGTFCEVNKLEGIILHENVESVGSEAFLHCGTVDNPCSIVVFNDQLTFTEINYMDDPSTHWVVYGHEGSAIQQQIAECQYIKFVAFDEETCTHPEDCRVKIAGSDATCQNTGMSDGEKCGLCEYITVEQTVIPGATHVWDTNYTVDTEPTCTEMGIQSIHCSVCDAIKEGTHAPIPALGHSYNEWTIEKPVKFGEVGIERQYCQNNCGEYNERELTIVDSGTCGETVTWTVDVDGILTISGTGAMNDYAVTSRPWHSYASKIKEVQIEEGVTTIGDYAFKYLESLIKVTLPLTLTEIGESAFYECRALEGVLDIPDSVTVIERNAFNVCESLTGVNLPSGLKRIEDLTFQYCHGLTGTLTIPEGVTYIGNLAFQNCSNIKAIELPNSLTSMYDTAFMGCTGITGEIVVPKGMTALSKQFSDTSITSIVLPFSVRSFGVNALSGIDSLKAVYIYNPECNIPDTTFANKDIVIYGMIDSTAQTFAESKGYTFQALSDEETILSALYYKLDDDGNAVITNCHAAFKGVMAIPAELEGHKVVAIDEYAFVNCGKITEVVIPSGVKAIGEYAFWNCEKMVAIILPENLAGISEGLFCGCTSLAEINLPESVTEIGKEAFESCDSLQNITILNNECNIFDREDTIPATTTITGYKDSTAKAYADKYGNQFVYYECLTGVHIYGDWEVTKIATAIEEGSARRDCAGCDAYEVQALALDANVLGAGSCGYDLDWILTADGQLRIYGTGSMHSYSYNNNQMTTAPWGAYASKLKTVVIEEGVTSIGNYAFYNCDMLTGNLNLPKTLTHIGYDAFDGCDGFNGSLVIPDSVTYMGSGAFENCNGFDGELILSKNLTEIPYYAFRGCSGFTGNLVIPDSVTTIRYDAFNGCSGFDGKLTLSRNLESIENNAFANCSGFTGELVLPATLKNLENYAFGGCSGFTGDLVIPESLTALSDYAFYECSGFDGKLVLPNSIVKLGNHVFAYCSGLTGELVLPENLMSIGDQAFYDCRGLTGAVIVPSTVTSIGYSAFGQTNFGDIYIPDSVVEYGHYGPGGYLEEVTYHIYPGSVVDQFFASTPEEEKIVYMVDEVYVPKQEDYLAFKSSSIAVTTEVDGIVNIMDLLVSNKELSVDDLEVEFSDDSVAMYFEGEIAGISKGECKITVTAGELTAKAMLKVTDTVFVPEDIMFTNGNVTIEKGLSAYVQPVILPFTAATQSLTWSSSNSSIVKVDSVGRITAVGAGTATITVRHSSGQTASYQVTSEVPIQDIIITESALPLEMHKGDVTKLDYYLYPFNSTDALKTQFINDNTDVVTIDSKGAITAVGSGTANIKIINGNIEKQVQVIVTNPLKGISIENAPTNAYNGDTFKLDLALNPVDADNAGTPVWSSSNESIATVDQDGNVTIKGVGYVSINVEVNEFTASCRIICPAVPVSEIVLNETSIDLNCGDTFTITAEKLPVNTTETKAFTWTSSDEKIATVDENGTVTAVTAGTVDITAAIGKVAATCSVTIEHEWSSEYSVDKAATCTENGVESIHCISCDASNIATEKTIPATGHTEAVRESVDATCTTDQMLGGTYCSTCGEIFSGHETVPGTALGHKYDEGTVTEPTCKAGGYTTYKCIRCDDSYIADKTDAVDHKYENYVSNNDATCTTDGTETAECIFGCGNKNTQTDKGSALGHDVKKWRITVFATSSQQGSRQGTCERCSNVITEIIPADPLVRDAGYCGDDLIWTFKHDGTLVISGEGRMYDYYSGWDKYKATEIKSLVIEEGITYIGEYAFDHCKVLTGTLNIPDTVTEIGTNGFAYCSGLTGSLVIPDSVRTIKMQAFYSCHNFDKELILSKNLKSIGQSAFNSCYGFKGELTLPDSLETIGEWAFHNCSGFTGNLVIPDGITTIEEYAFHSCSGMHGDIVISDKVKSIAEFAFSSIYANKIYVPDSVKSFGEESIDCGYGTQYYIYPNSAAEEYLVTKGYGDRIVYITDSIEPGKQIEYLDFKAQTIVTDVDTTVNVMDYLLSGKAITKDDLTVNLSNDEIAVYGDGQIVALGTGECTVTVSAGNLSCSAILKIKDNKTAIVRPETITFNETELVIEKGTTIFNQPVLLPVTVNDTTVYWTSSDSSVALVDYRGQVTGIGPGTVEITAKVSDTVYATYTVKVTSPLQQIIVPDAVSGYTINKGDTKEINFYTYPFDAEDKITFISSNEDVVTVDERGMMTATGAGKATVAIVGAGKAARVDVTVTNVLKGISMAEESVTIGSGNSLDLELIFHPADAEDIGKITWTSSNTNVATVDNNGRVTTVAVGLATITAEVDGFTASCRIVSKAIPLTGIELETEKVDLVYGDSYELTANRIPEDTSNKTPFTWTSSNEDIVTVDENGVVTATGVGVATVTAAVGDIKDSCEVTVGKADPEISIPEDLTVLVGKTLADIELPEGFAWDDDSQSVGERGTKTFNASYTPADTANYKIIEDVQIPVRVRDPKVLSVTMDAANLVCKGAKTQLKVNIETQDDPEYTVNWIVEDPSVVTVDENGVATVVGDGETKVTVVVGELSASGTIKVVDHTWSTEYTIDKAATCTEAGSKSIHCIICDNIDEDTVTEIPMLPHAKVIDEAVAPTCTETGLTEGSRCSACGEVFVEQTRVDALGHDLGKWSVIKEPGVGTTGEEKRECSRCDFTETREIPACVGWGYCGDDATWILDEEGTLTISGTGAITTKGYSEYYRDIKAIVIEEGITEIGSYAFDQLFGIKRLVLADSIKVIGNAAFCLSYFENVELNLPDSLEYIGDSAFADTTGLVGELVIPESVTSIGEAAFASCKALTGDLVIPGSVKNIGCRAFESCVCLESLAIENGVEAIACDAFKYCDKISGYVTLPESVSFIGQYAFSDCTSIERIIINNSECSIDYNAFADNIWLVGYAESTAEECQRYNGRFMTFCAHENIAHKYGELTGTEVSCTQDGDQLRFCSKCNYQDHVITPATGHSYSDWIVGQEGTCEVTGSRHKICVTCNEVLAEETYGGKGHNYGPEINYTAPTCTTDGVSEVTCMNCGSKKRESIPATGHSYGEWTVAVPADFGQVGIERQYCQNGCGTYADEREITIIDFGICGENATWTIDVYGKLVISGTGAITTKGYSEYYRDIRAIVIEEGITEIGSYAFDQVFGIEQLVLADSIKTIGDAAFCLSAFENVELDLPDSLEYIGYGAFADTTGLVGELIIPDSVTYIGERAFNGNTGFTGTLTIPGSVEIVDDYAFANCSNVSEIVLEEGIKEIGDFGLGITETYVEWDSIVLPKSLEKLNWLSFGNISFDTIVVLNPECNLNLSINVINKVVGYGGSTAQQYPGCIPAHMAQFVYICDYYGDEHTWSEKTVIKPPTCAEVGWATMTCTTCGMPQEERIPITTGHSYGEWTVVTPATFGQVGIERQYCQNGCGEYADEREINIISSGHCGENATYVLTVDGTLTISGTGAITAPVYDYAGYDAKKLIIEEGITRIETHAFFNTTIAGEVILPNSVEFVAGSAFLMATHIDYIVVLNPNCVLQDYFEEGRSVIVGKVGSTAQNYASWRGVEFKTICNYYGNEHTYGAGVVITQPTVTTPGAMTFTCNVCNHVKTTVLPALGPEGCDHTDVITLPAVGAGCETTGLTAGSQCRTCGTVLVAQTIIPAYGHSYDEGIVIKPPTAIENGIKEFTCKNCGNKKTTVIPAEGTIVAHGTAGPNVTWIFDINNVLTFSGTGAIEYNTQFAPYNNQYNKVIIEEGITEIYPQIFQNNTNVEEIVLPDSIKRIGFAAFAYADKLVMDPDLPDRLKVIEDHAFNGITFKKGELKLPQGLDTIGVGAFAYSTGLEGTLTIPGSCLNIGQSAFLGCTNINNLIIEDSISTLFEGTFDNCFGGQLDTVVLPASLINCDNAFGMIVVNTLVVKNKDTSLNFDGTVFMGKIVGHENSTAKELYNKVNGRPTPIVFQTLCDYYGTGHCYSEWVHITAPTCTVDDIKERVCYSCGDVETVTIKAPGHNIITTPGKEPTCTESGYTEEQYCGKCGEFFSAQKHIPATGHKNTRTLPAVKATCYTDGRTEGIECMDCKAIILEQKVIPAEHDFDEGVTGPHAVAGGQIVTLYTCKVCGQYYWVDAPPTDGANCKHESMTLIPGYDATCTEPGATSGVKCSTCGIMLIESAIIDPLGHNLGQWNVEQEATCTEDGYRYRNCSRCDGESYEVISATGHDYGTFTEVVTRATTAAAGKIGTYQYCMNCEDEDSAELISTTQIKKIAPVKISATAMAYTGKSRIPVLTVKDAAGKKLQKGTDYKVTIKNSAGKVVTAPKVVGKYKVTITFQGNYKGTVIKNYNINPKATELGKLTSPGKKQIKATWTKRTVQVTGYEIQYSTTKNFKKGTTKTVKVANFKTGTKTFKTTSSKKKYWVKIRTYKTVNNVKFYSTWSKVKTIKTK